MGLGISFTHIVAVLEDRGVGDPLFKLSNGTTSPFFKFTLPRGREIVKEASKKAGIPEVDMILD